MWLGCGLAALLSRPLHWSINAATVGTLPELQRKKNNSILLQKDRALLQDNCNHTESHTNTATRSYYYYYTDNYYMPHIMIHRCHAGAPSAFKSTYKVSFALTAAKCVLPQRKDTRTHVSTLLYISDVDRHKYSQNENINSVVEDRFQIFYVHS